MLYNDQRHPYQTQLTSVKNHYLLTSIMIVSRARTHYMSTHYVTLQVLLPFRVLSRNPSSFQSDKPESTDDVTNEEFEKALT